MFRWLLLVVSCLSLASAATRETLLAETLTLLPETRHEDARFLIQHMPERDLGALKPAYLAQHITLAHLARNEFPWGKDIPKDIFQNDVLPYASLDESRDNWREDFLKRFRPHLKDCKTTSEAAQKITRVIAGELNVQYNTKRRAANQGPSESMQLHMASCTGLSILLTDALRSVAIPARIVGTAMWTTKEGNHNWVEVWLPEQNAWRFTEYDPDPAGFDHGWLIPDAARALEGSHIHGIFASSWKATGQSFPMVWNLEDTSVPAVEVTRRYLELGAKTLPAPGECELRLEYLAEGQRRPINVRLMQGDVLTATGNTPSPTDDLNRFLTFRVKRGQLYQIYLPDGSVEKLEIGAKEETRKVTLKPETP